MKKFLKSKKSWIAFALAFFLVATVCISSSDAFLWATDDGEPENVDSNIVSEEVEIVFDSEEEEEESADVDSEEEEETADIESEEEEEAADAESEEEEEAADVESEEEEEVADVESEEEEETADVESEEVEEVAAYGYTVYYYYDDVEDEDARVEDEGALGDVILASVEEEAEYDGKDYVLDHVENEEGTISEDAEQNVVKVYYVLAEEEEVQKVERSVKVVSSLKGVETVEEGTSITLTAKLTGFDDVDYEIQWQRSEDGTDWEDVDGANDIEYTFDITEETEGYLWRVSVSTSEN